MSVRIKDLPKNVQPIARRFVRRAAGGFGGFTMLDVLAAGLWLLKNKSYDDVVKIIQDATADEAGKIVSAAEDDIIKKPQKHRHPPLKSG